MFYFKLILVLILFLDFKYLYANSNNIANSDIDDTADSNSSSLSIKPIVEDSFKASPYINVNGGWGKQTNLPGNGGTVAVNLGYRFIESFALEVGYQSLISSQYNTPLYNNYFSGAAKGYYVINKLVTVFSAAGLGLSYSRIGASGANTPSSFIAKNNNTVGGFGLFNQGIMFAISDVKGLSLKFDYIYTISFTGQSTNFGMSGLQYSF